MLELIKAIRLMGWKHMWKLGHGYRLGWADMMQGYFAHRTMQALLNVGFIDELLAKDRVNVASFAASRGLDKDILNALCEALYSSHLLKKGGLDYRLDSKGKLLVEVFRSWFELSYGYKEIFESLEALLKKEKIYGKDFYRLSDFVAKGSGEMESWLFFPIANEIIIRKQYARVLDLGCGDGTFLRKLCEINPDVRCYGIDLAPKAIADGQMRVREAGLEKRISLFAADISDVQELPEYLKTIQVATIFFVLHELLYSGEDRVIDFLKAFRKSFPGVPLIAFEAIRPTPEQMRERPGIAIYYYLYHDLSNQKPAPRDKWKELFRAAGFHSIDERYLGFARTAIYTLQ